MKLEIRKGRTDDARSISEFVTQLARRHLGIHLSRAGQEQLFKEMAVSPTVDRLNQGWPHFLAYEDFELCGTVVIRPPCHLYHLFVSTDKQGQGIGRKLFLHVDAFLRETSNTKVETVNSAVQVVEFYEALGFETDGPIQSTGEVQFQPMRRSV